MWKEQRGGGIYSTLQVLPDGVLRLALTDTGVGLVERVLRAPAAEIHAALAHGDLSSDEVAQLAPHMALFDLLMEHIGPAGKAAVPGRPDPVGEGGWMEIKLDFEIFTLAYRSTTPARRRARRLDGIWWEPTRRVGDLVEALRRDGHVDLIAARVDDPRAPRDLRVKLAESFGLPAPR